MQKILSCCKNRKALYWSDSGVQDCFYLRKIMYWMWYLSKEMSFWRYGFHTPRLMADTGVWSHSIAIHIINLPTNLETQVTHRYSANSFKLHRLPTPRPGQVLGLVGTNGIGKSTALKILSGKQKPNLGRYDNPPDWNETLAYFRGSELQNYLTKVVEDNIKAVVKPQYVDKLPQAIRGKVRSVKALLEGQCQRDNFDEMVDILGRGFVFLPWIVKLVTL